MKKIVNIIKGKKELKGNIYELETNNLIYHFSNKQEAIKKQKFYKNNFNSDYKIVKY